MENNYPFMNMAERKYLLSTEKLKENFRKKIEHLGTENIEFCQYYEILQECIGNLQELGHLTILTPDSYDYFSKAVEEYSFANSLEPWINWQAELFHSQKVEERYSYLKRIYNSGVKERNFSQKSNLLFRDVTENVGYVKINSFGEKHMKDDREVLRKWFLQNAYKEYIIIDITGNRGGTDYYWMDLIVAPNIESKMGYISYLITPYGEETREQFALCGIKGEDLKVIDENILELPEVNREDLEGAGYYKQKYLYISPSCEEKICSGQFFVLIDNHVNSAADGFAMFCKATGFAKLVGQSTKGDGGGSNVFMVRLPKSNLLMRFRAMMLLNPDGRSNAECGTIPDIVAKSPRGTALNPLNACLEYIRTQDEVP